MRIKCLVGIAFCASLLGCDQASLIKKWTPPEAESLARNYVDLLRQGEFDRIGHDLDPSVADSNVHDTFVKMAALIPGENPESVKVVGVNIFHGPEYTTTKITLEYQFPDKWLLVNIESQKKGNASTLLSFRVQPMQDSLENLNRFTFVGKGAAQYLILTVALCSFLFSLYVLLLCIRTKKGKSKWLWMLFILVGVGRLAVNWTTGEFTFTLFAFQIPCATAGHLLYGPWILAVYLPLGALLFLNDQWKRKVTGELIEPPSQRSEELPTPV